MPNSLRIAMPPNRLDQLYQRAQKLSTADKNYDYAHELLVECVINAPSSEQYADAMLRNLRAKHSSSKKRTSPLIGSANSRRLKKALEGKDWVEALRSGADQLNENPWEIATLRGMAMACGGLHCNESELVYLKQALDADAKNIEVNRHCAKSLGRMGQFDQAIACWHRIEKLAGGDGEAARMISHLAEEKLKYPGGIPPVTVQRIDAVKQGIKSASPNPKLQVEMELTPSQLLERKLACNTQDKDDYIRLAELQLAADKFSEAENTLNRGIGACGESRELIQLLQHTRQRITNARDLSAADAQRIHSHQQESLGVPWLEAILACAIVAALIQGIPSVGSFAWRLLDVGEWPRWAWFAVNLGVVGILLCIRFPSSLRGVQRHFRLRRADARPRKR